MMNKSNAKPADAKPAAKPADAKQAAKPKAKQAAKPKAKQAVIPKAKVINGPGHVTREEYYNERWPGEEWRDFKERQERQRQQKLNADADKRAHLAKLKQEEAKRKAAAAVFIRGVNTKRGGRGGGREGGGGRILFAQDEDYEKRISDRDKRVDAYKESVRRQREAEEAKRKAEADKAAADKAAADKAAADKAAAAKKEEEEAKKVEEEAKRKAQEEAKRKAQEEAKRKAPGKANRKASGEANRKAQEEAKRKAAAALINEQQEKSRVEQEKKAMKNMEMENIHRKVIQEKMDLELLVADYGIDVTISLLNKKLVDFSNEHNLGRLGQLFDEREENKYIRKKIDKINTKILNFNNNFFNNKVIKNSFIKIIRNMIAGNSAGASYQEIIITEIIKITVEGNDKTMESNFKDIMDRGIIGRSDSYFLKGIIKKAFEATIIEMKQEPYKTEVEAAEAKKKAAADKAKAQNTDVLLG